MITRRLLIEGLVQGVGYRAAMQAEAKRLGLTGWVRNCTNGSVEAVAQGSAESVERIIAWARHGPPIARVSVIHVATTQPEFERRFAQFEQLPTT